MGARAIRSSRLPQSALFGQLNTPSVLVGTPDPSRRSRGSAKNRYVTNPLVGPDCGRKNQFASEVCVGPIPPQGRTISPMLFFFLRIPYHRRFPISTHNAEEIARYGPPLRNVARWPAGIYRSADDLVTTLCVATRMQTGSMTACI
jgi:hypothetical protein